MNDTFMKEKAIFPLLTSMALPMVVSMLVNALYNIVDSLFVARISEEAMTALSLVYPVQNLINAIAIGFSIGIAALISLHLGAGNKEKADMAATHGMVLSLIHGVVISIVCTAIMPRFLRSFTSDETGYIGIHEEPDYTNMTASDTVVNGMTLFAERLDGVVKTTITEPGP